MTPPRELVMVLLSIAPTAARIRAALANVLGVAESDVEPDEAKGTGAVIYKLEERAGDYRAFLDLSIDATRAPGYAGRDRFVGALPALFGQNVLYDDGGSPDPTRWVLVRPDGARFEVFEGDASGSDNGFILDKDTPRKRLPDV